MKKLFGILMMGLMLVLGSALTLVVTRKLTLDEMFPYTPTRTTLSASTLSIEEIEPHWNDDGVAVKILARNKTYKTIDGKIDFDITLDPNFHYAKGLRKKFLSMSEEEKQSSIRELESLIKTKSAHITNTKLREIFIILSNANSDESEYFKTAARTSFEEYTLKSYAYLTLGPFESKFINLEFPVPNSHNNSKITIMPSGLLK
jgi:hypothetical protein